MVNVVKSQIKVKAFQGDSSPVSHLLLCISQLGKYSRQPLNLDKVGVP